ncbi:Golgi membrane protein 1 isoform X1 [Hippocampus comes]|uniref:Golgi membrane protein 1 n=1 Tax=Hippocampus comes TaxID=109280 RepID=A0A3Q3DXH8_HIPCM|nr:PREDICTED: Golgi membrane protein 1 isoform X1 [Hippocampus comes]XP_019722683.1 PREDICTED: Golgi membrane protein 1 isoform X1 [Hippocampus comes]XP_019722684.1 PREDICTED: Golgi membrane protein 1 isoform X1 [Hippocampus comes]
MGGLVNGRRGGRSPPLMIGALVACILVLGFNYWVSSSRNLELQTKLYELEGQVRRGAAERGADEVKKSEFQKEIHRQKDQIGLLESQYKNQLEGARDTCIQEKATLQQNISTSTKTIQELKGQLNQMNDDLVKLQKELQACQSNVKTLNDKLTYDMTQCNSQILTQKELCDERVAAAKLEVQKKMTKLANIQDEKAEDNGVKAEGETTNASLKGSDDLSHSSNLTTAKADERFAPYANNIFKERGAAADKEDVRQSDVTKDGIKKPAMALSAHTSKFSLSNNLTQVDALAAPGQGVDPGTGRVLIGRGEANMTALEEKLENYDRDDKQVLGGGELGQDKEQQTRRDETIDKIMEEELADYNGDDDNEGEFEADKQAELAQD